MRRGAQSFPGLPPERGAIRAHLCHTPWVWVGRRFAVAPPPHQTSPLALASAVPERVSSSREMHSEVRHGAQTVHRRPVLFHVERASSRGVRAGGRDRGGGGGEGERE